MELFEVLSGLKQLGYPTVESLWYHDTTEINEIVPLKEDIRAKGMKTIIVINGNVHLYVLHPILQPDIIEKPILSLDYNVVGPSENVGNDVQKDNMNEVSEESNEGETTKSVTIEGGTTENVTTDGTIELNQEVEGVDLKLELDEGFKCNHEEVEGHNCNQDEKGGFEFNQAVYEGL
ncbi:hypothetical protein KIW84_045375 [Lathyrus oleraceus]|uniref:Uncharacterized protein n=1 Tax=Pisum sativum TaxID=3888 RepID=A0A9D5AX50_PEA|nr:hypothetical protein KIW84_045375 [Pisum sativum]